MKIYYSIFIYKKYNLKFKLINNYNFINERK